jgi:hypothetical protein
VSRDVANADDLRQLVAKEVDELRQLIAQADALASAAEDLFCRVRSENGTDRRHLERMTHLLGLTAVGVQAASQAGDKLAVAVSKALPRTKV